MRKMFWLLAAAALVLTGGTPAVSAVPKPKAMSQAAVWDHVVTTDPVAFITIDDGYAPDNVVAADYIRDHNIPVTMFLTYYAVNTHPAFFRTLGPLSSVQFHSKNHLHLPAETNVEQNRQISLGTDWLATLFGARPTLFRPPYGEYNTVTLTEAMAAGYPGVVLWSHSYTAGVVTGGAITAGSIILMHFDAELMTNLSAALAAITAAGLKPALLTKYLPKVC
jgi:peptidoglycan/xylan/chitin deacetylase (PgdA/CDA1 family)